MTHPILVTGAQGFLGRYVVARLLDEGANVIGVGRSARDDRGFSHQIPFGDNPIIAPLPIGLRQSLQTDRYRYEQCDLALAQPTNALIERLRPQRIIHLAAALRDESPELLFAANVTATLNLCRAASAMSVSPDFLLGSTGSVYGAQTALPVPETAHPQPIGVYAASKYMGEIAARAITRDAGMPLSIVRIFNILGPGLQPRHLAALVAHAIAEMEVGRRPPRLDLGDLSTTRDFIDVRDVARLMCDLPVGGSDIINAGSGVGWRSDAIVRHLLERATLPIELTLAPALSRAGADHIYADMTKAHRRFLPHVTIEQSLSDMLAYARTTAEPSDPPAVPSAQS